MSEELEEQKTEENVSIESLVEAVLFMHGAPVTFKKIGTIIDSDLEVVRDAVHALQKNYIERGAGLTVLTKDDSAQIATSPSHTQVIEKFTRKELEGDLSNAALEVLAIIAYRGPLTKPDIEAIRGVNCAFTLRNLLLRGLVERVAHPTDQRTKLYRVTFDFLRTLGIDDIAELPQFEELAGDKRIDAVLYSVHSALDADEESDE